MKRLVAAFPFVLVTFFAAVFVSGLHAQQDAGVDTDRDGLSDSFE